MTQYPKPPPPPQQINYTSPEADRAHLFTLSVGVALPLSQSIVTGLFTGTAIASIAELLSIGPGFWQSAGAAWSVTQCAAWLLLLIRYQKLTTPILETLTGIDLDGNGAIGSDQPKTLRVEIGRQNGQVHTTNILDLPINDDALIQIADGMLHHRPFSLREWTGAGKPLSRQQFEQLRDAFLRAALITPNNPHAPQQGYALTVHGLKFFQQIAGPPTPPPRPTRA